MYQNDINFHFKTVGGYIFVIFQHAASMGGRTIYGEVIKRSQKAEVNKNFVVIMENPPLADKISLVSC